MAKTTDIPLDKFQQWMQHMLLNPLQKKGINPTGVLPSEFDAAPLDAIVNHSGKLPANEHLAIYQRSYIARLRNCMSQQFSALEYALGEELFRGFADDYLVSYPSTSYNLAGLGAHFAQHLQDTRPDAHDDVKEDWIDFIIELARFEYDINVLFEQKAEEGYQLADTNTPEDKMEPLPLCALFKFQFPVRSFYLAFKNGENPALPFGNESYCLVLRYNYKLFIYDLNPQQFEFLTLLKSGMSISAAQATFKQQNQLDANTFDEVWPVWKQYWIEAKFFRI